MLFFGGSRPVLFFALLLYAKLTEVTGTFCGLGLLHLICSGSNSGLPTTGYSGILPLPLPLVFPSMFVRFTLLQLLNQCSPSVLHRLSQLADCPTPSLLHMASLHSALIPAQPLRLLVPFQYENMERTIITPDQPRAKIH